MATSPGGIPSPTLAPAYSVIVTTSIEFVSVLVQLIPVFLLALVFEHRIVPRAGRRQLDRVAARTIGALEGLAAMSLGFAELHMLAALAGASVDPEIRAIELSGVWGMGAAMMGIGLTLGTILASFIIRIFFRQEDRPNP